MSRRSNRNRRRGGAQGGIVKAQAQLPGTVSVPVSALVQALTTQQSATVAPAEPLPRDLEWARVPFGPGMPLVPKPINPPRIDSGRPEPRRYDYPVSANLLGVDQRLLPWKVLRDAADRVDLIRRCIEVRKADLLGHGWDIVVSDEALDAERRADDGASDHDLAKKLRDQYGDDIDRVKTWWKMPDRTNGLSFDDWLMQLMEEHLVLDALAIYPRFTLGGDLWALEVIDGTTIKPLLDDRGNTPAPPNPAYQQVLLGFPRGEFVADAVETPEGEYVIEDAYRTDQLVYGRRVVRTWTPYGYSPVEQALVSADLWLKRQQWMAAEYTDGAVPSTFITTDFAYTPEQLTAYEGVLNDRLAGNTGERRRAKMLPKGMAPAEQRDAAERYRPEYDEFLVKLVCSHLGVLPTRLGFTPKGGLGGKGHQDGEEDTQDRQSTRPTTEWLAALITRMSRMYLGMPDGLEFRFLGLDAEDEAHADDIADKQVRVGRITLNEDRDRLGKPRYDFAEADMPMIIGQSGVIFLEGQKDQQDAKAEQAATLVQYGPPGTQQGAPQVPAGSSPPGSEPPAAPTGPPAPPKAGTTAAKADELAALRRFVAKAETRSRREFVAEHLTAADLHGFGDLRGVVVKVAAEPESFDGAKADDASSHPAGRVADPARAGDRSARTRHRAGFEWGDH